MIKTHCLYPAGCKEIQENAAPASNIQHWTAAGKKLYNAPLNPADQIFAAAEFVKTDRLHMALQSHEPVRLALDLASLDRPSAHLARDFQAVHANLRSCIIRAVSISCQTWARNALWASGVALF